MSTLPADLDFRLDPSASPDRMNRATSHIDARIRAIEVPAKSYLAVIAQLQSIGLQRLDEALTPVYQALVAIAQLGALFTTTSATTLTVGTGLRTLMVAPADRQRFAAASYLLVQADADPTVRFGGQLRSYDRDTGALTLLVDQVGGGSGVTRDAWQISASADAGLYTAYVDAGITAAEASAPVTAAIDLGALPALKVALIGSGTVASFGAVPNRLRQLRFTGSATLTHSPASLSLPGGANIITAAGDTALATSDAVGAWTVWHYQRANGLPLGVRRGQLLRAVSQTLSGGLAAFLDSGAIPANPDDPANVAYYHEPFALPGGVLAGILTTYCQTSLGMSTAAATTQVAALFTTASILTPNT